MFFKDDSRNPRRIIGEVSKSEFNTIISRLNDIIDFYNDHKSSESVVVIQHCECIKKQLTQYSYFDTDNEIVRVSFFAKEVGLLLHYMVNALPQVDKFDYFDDLVSSSDVKIWKN